MISGPELAARQPAGLTPAALRAWVLEEWHGGEPPFIDRAAVRLDRSVDVSSLVRWIERWPRLRAACRRVDGVPTLELGTDTAAQLVEVTGGASFHDQLSIGFDLDGPLVRFVVGPQVLGVAIHRVLGEAETVLRAALTAAEPELVSGMPAAERVTLERWRQRLLGAAELLPLPLDRPRPPVQTWRGHRQRFPLDESAAAAIDVLTARLAVATELVLVGVTAVLLHRYTGTDDFLLGIETGRTLAPLRVRLAGDISFRSAVAVISAALDEGRSDPVPIEQLFDELVKERDLSRAPLVHVSVGVDGGCASWPRGVVAVDVPPMFLELDVALSWRRDAELSSWQLVVDASSDVYTEATIVRFARHLEHLLRSAAAHPDDPLMSLGILSDDERIALVVESNRTSTPYPHEPVHRLFASMALAVPERTAVISGDRSITYGELRARSSDVARFLVDLGVGPGALVGVCIERSIDLMVALLGVLESGAAYVPVEPTYPHDRIAAMLDDAGPLVVLTECALLDALPPCAATIVCIDRDWDRISASSARDSAPSTVPSTAPLDDLAYVIFTSGSTGRPKGVQIPHRALTNLLVSMTARPGIGPDDVMLGVTTPAFDLSVPDLYLALVNGATLVLAPPEVAVDPIALAGLLDSHGVTVMQATPATWRMLVDAGWMGRPELRVLCGGDALAPLLARELLDRCGELWNMYGPTETCVWSSCDRVVADAPITIGAPFANTTMYILDGLGAPVPVGVVGELCIGGHGVAAGYLGRPELTIEKFVPDPYASGAGLASDDRAAMMYRTGDLARWRVDGSIEFVGRVDNQVKIRGYRIELGEIEAALIRHADVAEALVLSRPGPHGSGELVAYVTRAAAATPSTAELRRYATETLPVYMVPAVVLVLDRFPLTPNGKINRLALPVPAPADLERVPREGPASPIEELVADVWSDVLSVRSVGRAENFFELGGNSLLATRVAVRLSQQLEIPFRVGMMFADPTVAGSALSIVELLAAALDGGAEIDLQRFLDDLDSEQGAGLDSVLDIGLDEQSDAGGRRRQVTRASAEARKRSAP